LSERTGHVTFYITRLLSPIELPESEMAVNLALGDAKAGGRHDAPRSQGLGFLAGAAVLVVVAPFLAPMVVVGKKALLLEVVDDLVGRGVPGVLNGEGGGASAFPTPNQRACRFLPLTL
jgi:hypothetical protein